VISKPERDVFRKHVVENMMDQKFTPFKQPSSEAYDCLRFTDGTVGISFVYVVFSIG
jgi:hypothetical protein